MLFFLYFDIVSLNFFTMCDIYILLFYYIFLGLKRGRPNIVFDIMLSQNNRNKIQHHHYIFLANDLDKKTYILDIYFLFLSFLLHLHNYVISVMFIFFLDVSTHFFFLFSVFYFVNRKFSNHFKSSKSLDSHSESFHNVSFHL